GIGPRDGTEHGGGECGVTADDLAALGRGIGRKNFKTLSVETVIAERETRAVMDGRLIVDHRYFPTRTLLGRLAARILDQLDDVVLSHPLRPSLCSLRRLRFAGRDAGQRDTKPRPPAKPRFERQSAAKLLRNEIEDDVEPKPGPALAAARREERIERATLDLVAHADSVIGHEDVDVVAHLPRLDDDASGAPVGKSMNDAVEEQVGQDLPIRAR